MAQLIQSNSRESGEASEFLRSPWVWAGAIGGAVAITVIAFLLMNGSPVSTGPQRALTSDEEGFGPIPVTNSRPGVNVPNAAAALPGEPLAGAAPGIVPAAAPPTAVPPGPPPGTYSATGNVGYGSAPSSSAAPAPPPPPVQNYDSGLPPAPMLQGSFGSGGGSSVSTAYAGSAPGGVTAGGFGGAGATSTAD